tara:strand:- start:130317 stop:131828 length:1512 start_codon:yes stop_codon:yes gene_type:complete
MHKELINIMSPQEKSGFVTFLKDRNKRNTNRGVLMFKGWLDGSSERLKKELNTNAYNVLKKRTTDLLLEYIAQSAMYSFDTMDWEINKDLMIAKRLLSNEPTKTGFKLLKNAEKKARKHRRYNRLDEVYQLALTYSYHPLSEAQEEIITKLQKNEENLNYQRYINRLYAKIRKAFYQAEFNGETIDLKSIVTDPFRKFQQETPEAVLTYSDLYKIIQILDIYAAQVRNYYEIGSFIEDQWKRVEGHHPETAFDVRYKIEIIYLLANIHFRKKDFSKSMYYLRELEKELEQQGNLIDHQYQVQFATLKALNLHFSDRSEEALKELERLLESKKHPKKQLYTSILTKCLILFHQGAFKLTARLLNELSNSDKWYEKTVGIDWNIHRKLMEILLYVELEHIDLAVSRLKSFKRKYKRQLSDQRNEQAIPFLNLLQTYIDQPLDVNKESFRSMVEESFDWRAKEEEDLFFMCFYAWLKSKMENQPLYRTTLDLLNHHDEISQYYNEI